MRVLLISVGLGLVLAAGWFVPVRSQGPAPAVEQKNEEILAVFSQLAKAYADRDAKKFAALWSEKAEYVSADDEDERLQGRAAIEKDFAETFAKLTKVRLEIDVNQVRRVGPDVVSVDGTANVLRPRETPARSRFLALLIRTKEGWLIDSVRESKLPAEDANADYLQDLAWLNGAWTHKNGDSEVFLECKEVANGNFRSHKFRVKEKDEVVHEGTQIIGWDASWQQLRSWVFSSDGSFGEGTIDNKDKTWTNRVSGVLPDGQLSSATQILTRTGADQFTWEVIDRQVGERTLPNVPAITVTRSAPQAEKGE